MLTLLIDALLDALHRDRVTATFLVTSPSHTRVRADLYNAGVDFSDDRIAFFDWAFTVRSGRRAWERFTALCGEQLQHLEVAPA